MTIPIKANRAYPSLPAPGSSLEAHTRLLEALKEAVEIHERRIPNAYLDSFVRLRELIELGIMQARGNQIVLSLDAVLPSNVALYDGDVSQFSNGTFADGRIAESNVTQHQAALVIDWSQLTSVPSIFPPGSHTHSASDITTGTLSDARLSSNVALYDGDVGQFTSGTFDDARIAESNVTQHQAALSISWSQLTDVPPIVLESRKIDTGTGLTGGGDLSQDRTIALDATTQSALALATSAVQPGDLAAVATSGDFGDLSDVPAMVSSLGALSDPDADRIVFWDDSADALAFLEIGTGLEISGTSLQLTSAAQNALTLAATALQPGDNISALTNDTGYITGIGGFSIGDLADVNIGTPGSGEDGYALVWDNDEGEFVLAPVSGGGGTVTSVAVSVPTGFTVTGSPITSSGTIEIEYDTGYQGFTSAEAALIASAVQPGDLAAVAFSGDYDDLTNVPSTFPPAAHTHSAEDITSGTLAEARLSSNVALLNRTPQTFTGINIFRSAPNVYGAVEIGPSTNISLQLGSYDTASTDIVSVVNQTTASGGLIRGASQGHLVLALRENDTTDSVSIISGGGNYTSDTTYDTLVAQFLANGNTRIGGTLAWGGGDAIASSSLVPLKNAPNVFTEQQTIQHTSTPILTVERDGPINAFIEAKTTAGSVYFGNRDGSTFAIGATSGMSSPWATLSGAEFEVNATLLDFNGNADISGTLAVGGTSTFSSTVTLSGAAGNRVFDIVNTSASQIWAMRALNNQLQIGARTSTGSWSNPPAFILTRSGDTITQVEVPVALTVGGTISGNGSGLTNLNASNLSSGTVPDARLSSNVMLTGAYGLGSQNLGSSVDMDFVNTTQFDARFSSATGPGGEGWAYLTLARSPTRVAQIAVRTDVNDRTKGNLIAVRHSEDASNGLWYPWRFLWHTGNFDPDTKADVDSGSFTATLTGVSGTVQGTIDWYRVGRLVTLYSANNITGTANAIGMSLQQLPASLRPTQTRDVPSIGMVANNAAGRVGRATVLTNGGISFAYLETGGVLVVFPSTGAKGLEAGWSITYLL